MILNIFTVSDGTVTWRLRDARCKYEVGDIIPKVGNPKDYEYLILADGGSFDSSYTELGKIYTDGKVPNLKDGIFLEGASEARKVKGADTWYHERGFVFDASKSNSIYGASDTVQPKSYTVKYYICYGG